LKRFNRSRIFCLEVKVVKSPRPCLSRGRARRQIAHHPPVRVLQRQVDAEAAAALEVDESVHGAPLPMVVSTSVGVVWSWLKRFNQ
jgi:hypothetical protein